MQPNVPISTDNLYKFLATFGLAIIIASLVGIFLAYKSSNDELYLIADRFYEISKDGQENTEAGKGMKDLLNKRIDVVVSNRRSYLFVLFPLFGAGWAFSLIGFKQWKKSQETQDELLELQVAKARKETHGSNVYRELPERPKPKKPAKKPK